LVSVGRQAYHRIMSIPVINIDELAPEERLQLIGDLWESLRAEPESVRLSSMQRDELNSRLDELDRGDVRVISWDEARLQLRGQPE